jgi:excisionase family DNA binding protein
VNTTNGELTTQASDARFLTPRDLQRELRIGERLCYKLLQAGAIPSIRVNGLYRIRREDLEEVLENGAVLEANSSDGGPRLAPRPRRTSHHTTPPGKGVRGD